MNLKILTYNILDGGHEREAQILAVLQHARPDIILLQEVYEARLVRDLGQALEMIPFFGEGRKQRHVALLSRLPVISRQSHYPFPPIWRNFIEAAIEYLPGKQLRVFGIHPIAGLEFPYEWWRWLEARRVLSYARPFADEPCIIAGDFNAAAPHDPVEMRLLPKWLQVVILLQGGRIYRWSLRAFLRAGFTDSFRYLNPEVKGYTFSTSQPDGRLDYILVNEILKPALRSCKVVLEPEQVHTASDHYPVMAELEI